MKRVWMLYVGVLALTSVTLARASVSPSLMSYQGVLRSGTSTLEGAQDMVFRFFASESGGDALLIDSHTGASGGAVTASAGTFQVMLGGGVVSDGPATGTLTGLSDLFAQQGDVYLETEVNGEVMAPRVRIASAAYALNAHTLDGQGASAFVPVSTNASLAFKSLRQGATLLYENASTVRVKPGVLGFPDGKLRESTGDLVWSFTNGVGPLGLDVGAEAANTWYYLYAVPNAGNDDQFTVVASISAPTQVGGTGPVGYATARFVGSVKNGTTSDLWPFNRSGGAVQFYGLVGQWANSTGAESPLNTWSPVSTVAYQPLTSRSVYSDCYYDAWNSALAYYVAPTTSTSPIYYTWLVGDWGDGVSIAKVEIPTVGRQFYWRAEVYSGWANGTGQFRQFSFSGYGEDLTEY